MKIRFAILSTIGYVSVLLLLATAVFAQDADGDGVLDSVDNCTLIPNPTQVDDSGDGIGDLCDVDFNDDGIVGAADWAVFRTWYTQTAPPAPDYVDVEDDGFIGGSDAARVVSYFGGPPGPSAAPAAVPVFSLLMRIGLGLGVVGSGFLLLGFRSGRRFGSRTVQTGILALLMALVQAEIADAQTTVSLTWTSTTGAGTVGSDTIVAAPGDVLIATATVTPDAGKVGYASFSYKFDADLANELDANSTFQSPAVAVPPEPYMSPLYSFNAVAESDAQTPGVVTHCVMITQDYLSDRSTPFELCKVEFVVTANVVSDGPDIVAEFSNTGIDAIIDAANNVLVPPAVTVLNSLTVDAP